MGPWDLKIVLRVNQLYIDVSAITDEAVEPSCCVPGLLDPLSEESLKHRIWLQWRKYWYDATNGVILQKRWHIREACNKNDSREFDTLFHEEMLRHCCSYSCTKALTQDDYPVRRYRGNFHSPSNQRDAISNESRFERATGRVAEATVIYSHNMNLVRSRG